MSSVDQIIDRMGGTKKVSVLCGISAPAVSQWRKRGIPKPWRKYLTKIRPKAFK